MKREQSKASKIVDDLTSHPLTSEEMAKRRGSRPELRVRSDAPSIEINETTPAAETIARLEARHTDTLALREPGGEAKAVVLSIERYLELIGTELATDPFNKVATLDGRITPSDTAVAAAYVEQVDPTDTWMDRGTLAQ